MKKIIFCLMILILINIPLVIKATNLNTKLIEEQEQTFGINSFLKESKKYSGEFFDGINISDLFTSAISGKVNNSLLGKRVLNLLGNEVKDAIKTLASVLVIIIIHSILKALTDNLNKSGISKIVYYMEYILIVSLIMENFADIINTTTNTINNMTGFMNSLIPLLTTLMIYTGSIATSGIIQPIILFVIEFVGNIISNLILPCVSLIAAILIISKLSDKVQISKLATFMKSSVIWVLGIILTAFVGIVSLEGTLSSSVDGISAKTAKAAVSSLIPIVGKILGDAVDTVLGCSLVLKNAIGIVGVLIIIGICIMPIIKLTILSIMYSLASSIIEPLADEKIVKLLGEMSGIFKLLLAILCSISVLLIIGITLTIKISNSGMMYR